MKKIFKTLAAVAATAVITTGAAFSLTACAPGDLKIGIPDDGTNQQRAIKLLEKAGLIEVDPAAGYNPELTDITKYNYNIEIVPVTANTLPSVLGDFGACTINGTYAAPYGLSPSKDALIVEKQDEGEDNPYVNVIVARTADKDNETYLKVVEAFQTQTVAQYMVQKYDETYIPSFEYDASAFVDGLVEEIDAYVSAKEGKTVVTIGVCGASNDYYKAVQKVLDDENAGIYIELKQFDAYNLPNEALNHGDIDLNSFQHKAFLNNEIKANSYQLSVIGETLIAPLSLYSQKYTTLDALKEAAGIKA